MYSRHRALACGKLEGKRSPGRGAPIPGPPRISRGPSLATTTTFWSGPQLTLSPHTGRPRSPGQCVLVSWGLPGQAVPVLQGREEEEGLAQGEAFGDP